MVQKTLLRIICAKDIYIFLPENLFLFVNKGKSSGHFTGSVLVFVNPSKRISCVDCDATELHVVMDRERRLAYYNVQPWSCMS
jgi:hypothetical protein